MNREEAYDTLINPLMAQIIAICKEHDIPMVASFEFTEPGSDDVGLCNTCISGTDMNRRLIDIEHVLYDGWGVFPPTFGVTIRGGTGAIIKEPSNA